MKTLVAVVIMGSLGAVFACRQGEPTGDPKTPANSPLPQIERRAPDAPDTKPSLGDAG